MKLHSWPLTVRILVVSCLVGTATGIIGTAWTTNYLADYALQLGQLTEPLRLTQEQPRVTPKTYEDALVRLEERALQTVGVVVEDVQISLVDEHHPVFALTSDGWAFTARAEVGDVLQWPTQRCEVDVVVPERISGYVFVHCGVSNIPVVDIASAYAMSAGDQLFVVSGSQDVVFTQVRSVGWGEEVVRSSDRPARRIVLTSPLMFEPGSPAFNIFGELVGVVSQDGTEIVPFEQLSGAFRQVLQGTTRITYPSLGVEFVDLAHTTLVSDTLSQSRRTGALLYGSRAVERGGPAQQAGLLAGDIILSVNGTTLSATRSLDDLIVGFRVEEQVTLDIQRDGVVQTIVVPLGERAI